MTNTASASPEKLRILFITNGAVGQMGGASKFYYPASLAKIGVAVALVAEGIESEEACLKEAGVELYLNDFKGGGLWARLKVIKVALESFRPDIVHVFFHRWAGIYPLIFFSFGQKWLLDLRGPLLASGVRRLASVALNNLELLSFDGIATHAESTPESIFGHTLTRATLTRIGVDVCRIIAEESKYQDSARVLRGIYIGALHKVRGLEKMIDAFAKVAEKRPISVDLYGSGDAVQEIERQIVAAGLSESVRVKGMIPRNELYTILPTYDYGVAYIGPAIYDGAPPLKTLEYMAAGLPVVASDTVGNRSYIKDGVNGFIAGASAQEFAVGIERLVESDKLRSIGISAREIAMQNDWLEICEHDLLPLYKKLLDEGLR